MCFHLGTRHTDAILMCFDRESKGLDECSDFQNKHRDLNDRTTKIYT